MSSLSKTWKNSYWGMISHTLHEKRFLYNLSYLLVKSWVSYVLIWVLLGMISHCAPRVNKFAYPHMISHEWFPYEFSYLLVKKWVSHVLIWVLLGMISHCAPRVNKFACPHMISHEWFPYEFLIISNEKMFLISSYEFSCNENSQRDAMFSRSYITHIRSWELILRPLRPFLSWVLLQW